jgi:hypothetical protein
VGSLAEGEKDVGPLLRTHLSTRTRISRIRFLKGIENPNHFLH